VIAIALAVYAASNVVHEGLGHGAACVALGGRPLVISTVHFDCGEDAMTGLARRGVAAAGTIANFIAGTCALLAFKRVDARQKPHAAYFLWLFATVNLLMGAGYFLFSGVAGIGDWMDVAIESMSPLVWRPAMSIVGGLLYVLLARLAAQRLRALVGRDGLSFRRSRMLTVPAYVAGGLLCCVAGVFNPVGPILIAISAAASSLGGTSGLLWLTQFARGGAGSAEAVELERSYVWIVAGGLASLLFVGILGRGVHF
jgi:hypothetical protein